MTDPTHAIDPRFDRSHSKRYTCVGCHTPRTAMRPGVRCHECSETYYANRTRLRQESRAVRQAEREVARAAAREAMHIKTFSPRTVAPPCAYDDMRRRVEAETGTDSATWTMLDARWDRVCYLTRERLDIPHEGTRSIAHMGNRGIFRRERNKRKQQAEQTA